ncbi:DUF6531 domain-containing protein [Curtobacterium caseinilyticum]|uniref:DUF6531 domain-containing protein n=1 Tax=Curtobacterium caseinilyticum TaxID=3055137 RepID=A0ABT7TMC7_9MICO|nr:DUF6531 domain-containing protein [Curtobacterium caseinilyticum]MDM7890087.1 DUF6531 domain-containing protein [Curtobacterium caseinilyticum]
MAKVHGNDPTGYSYGDADALKTAARNLASAIDGQTATRAAAVTSAGREFRGYFSQVFADNAGIASRSASKLSDALSSLVGFVDELREAAKQEDRRRADAKAWEARKREREENFFVGAAHEVSTWFGAEDDPKPPEPEPEPQLQADAVSVRGRTIPAGGGGSGGTSSAVPADLRSFASSTRGADDSLSGAVSSFRNALADYESGCNTCWGTLHAQSLVTAVQDWLTDNGHDASWADTVAAQFEAAGGGSGPATLSDASIAAALASAGVAVGRDDFTIGPFSAMGTPPTNGFADDPVNTATGNFLEPEDDLTFGGAAASLRFSRMYNSLDTRVGAFGVGWSSVLDVRLELGDELASVVLEDGRQVDFPRDGDGWGRGVGQDLWLRREATALVVTDNTGVRRTFSPAGVWLRTGRGPGTGVTVLRDDDDRITRLEHELGRAVDVEYDGDRVASVSTSDGRRVEYLYDDARRLVAVQDAVGTRGYRWNDAGLIDQVTAATGVVECINTYDDRGRVVEQRSPFGRTVRFSYLQGRVTSVSDTDGSNANTWIADRNGRVVGIVDSDGARQSMSYDRHGHLVSVTERDGSVTVHGYDDRGRRTRTVTPDGADVTYAHDDQDRTTTVVTADGGIVEYEYRGDERNPSVVTDPVGGRTVLEWRAGQLARCTDPTGVVVTFHHDEHGDLVAIEDADGGTARFVRDAAGRVVEAATPLGARTSYRYDAAGLLTAREAPDGGVWRFEHDDAGRVIASTDPTGARTAVEYGAHGEITATTDPLGRQTTKRFDELGNVSAVTLPDGAEWRFVHDALSRLRTVVDPAGGSWTREYDAIGAVTATLDPTGVRTAADRERADGTTIVRSAFEDVSVRTDALGRPVSVLQSDGSAIVTVRDAAGRIVESLDGEGGLTRFERDLAGRVVAVTTPAGRTTTYTYDRCGRPVTATDPLGGRTSLRYDADGRVVERTDANGDVERTEYDAVGRVTSVDVPALGMIRYRYDRAGRVVEARDPRFGRRSFRYDAAGQLVAATNGLGGVTRYEYDGRGRLVRTTDPLGAVTTRTYTELDKVASSTDPLGRTTSATYDAAGRQVSQTEPDGTVLRWEYDAAGREAAQYVDDALAARIERDPRSRTVTISDHTRPGATSAHLLEYDRRGLLVRRVTDGRETRWTYDADGLRTSVHAPDGSVTRTERDPAGRKGTVEHTAFGDVHHEYDGAGRPTAVRTAGTSDSWSHDHGFVVGHTRSDADTTSTTRLTRDRDGRLVRIERPGTTTVYEHDAAMQLVRAATDGVETTWSYDAAGRLVVERTGGGTRTFEYDDAGQLVAVTGPEGRTSHEYDARGQRVRSTAPDGTATRYSWDGRGWLRLIAASSSSTSTHVDALGDLVDVDGVRLDWDAAAAVPTLLAVDDSPVLRTPVGLLGGPEGTGATGWRTARSTPEADPWQLLAAASGDREGALSFGADGTPVVAGLEWMGARAYDPATRAFLSTDPITAPAGAAWGANPYSFAGNDPLHAVDPLGLAPITDAELEAYAAAEQGPLARAAAATGDWFGDNWEYVAGGAMVVAGGALMLTGVGGPLGGMLIGAGADTIIQKATTGEVNWGQVAVSGAFGMVGGGLGAAIGKHFVGNAVEGAVENVANTVVSGQPLTPGKLLGSAVEGAATSAATGGTMSKVHLPSAVNKLGDEIPTPFDGQKIYRVYGGNAKWSGASWSPTHPGSVSDYRDIAGLPSGRAESGYSTNSGRFLIEGTLLDPDAVVLTREALPLDGNRGGLDEYIIPHGIENGAIRVDNVSGVNPEF